MTSLSASLFALPLAPWQQPQSVRATKYDRKRRRKENEWGDEDDSEEEAFDVQSGPELTTPGSSSFVLSSEEAHQYRIAGLPFDQELPGGHFPHTAAGGISGHQKPRRYNKELSALSPPLYVPQSPAQQGNLRYQHLAVITTILHRCLLEGDYVRAGRAWGLIIRENISGHPIDVRHEGKWGIGAEILLRRDSPDSQRTTMEQSERVDTRSEIDSSRCMFTRKGFEDAKTYYERLILHYPYRKASPDAVSSLDFYPAMFGLWIYVVQEESHVARDALRNNENRGSESPSEEDDAMSESDLVGEQSRGEPHDITAVRSKELDEAQQIAARIDELLVSPPYSDSPEILRLRGMVALWVGDLFVSVVPQSEDDASILSDDDHISMDESPESMIARRERRLAMEKRDLEVEKSKRFLERAKMRSRGTTHSLEDLHI